MKTIENKKLNKLAQSIVDADPSKIDDLIEQSKATWLEDGCNPLDLFWEGLNLAEEAIAKNLSIYEICIDHGNYVFHLLGKDEQEIEDILNSL